MNVSGERTRSLWMAQEDVAPKAPRLDGEQRCDTVVVGAGIAGLSAAYELATAGHKVIVLDRGPIAGGTTSRTTAHLTAVCDDGVGELLKLRGEELSHLFAQSHGAAIDRIETIVKEHRIVCNFRRLDAFLFPALGMGKAEARKQFAEELDALKKTGIEAERIDGVPLKGFEDMPVIRYPRQATFHPLKYLRGLVDAIEKNGGLLFADSAVTGIEERENGVRVITVSGSVTAAQIVVATNSPINDRVALHTKMAPYRTYAMAFTLPRGALPDGLYWDAGDPYHYVRLNPGPGSIDYLIAGGSDHKTGEADDGDIRFEAVEAWIRALLPQLGKVAHRWSGQVLDTFDYCAFIGLNPGNERTYVVTGDSGMGITHGALAGLLLKDLILTGESPWQAVYEPSRKPPPGLLNYIKENVTPIQNFAEYLLPAELDSVDELKPGEGGIIRSGLSKIAASRGKDGKLSLVSAVCTHLGCHVHWNSTEQCWDCPCHGSQFAPNGAVLHGPAIAPLEPATISAKAKADS